MSRIFLLPTFVVALMAGCSSSDLVACGNDRFCAAGTICSPDGTTCIGEEEAGECATRVTGSACNRGGVCMNGECVLPRCGNGMLDDGEVCDDGNRLSNDGCREDCLSDERCGNGIVDYSQGEECDCGRRDNVPEGCTGPNSFEPGATCRQYCFLPRCGDGRVDPREECDAGARNSEKPDAPCRSNCRAAGCGDGIVDPAGDPDDPNDDEVCDDGNRASGDGCAFDCRSDETCGNGIVDYLVGEQCDDGNDVPDDGCDRCVLERATWTQRDVAGPPPRAHAALVTDLARDAVLLFGGLSLDGPQGDTWTWTGASWRKHEPASAPSPRYGAGVAFDPWRGTVLLFGGCGADAQPLGDTWEWNGSQWAPVATLNAPAPTCGAAMWYDPRLGGPVLFGGAVGRGRVSALTWWFDGDEWRLLSPDGLPEPRAWPHVAYDRSVGELILWGGRGADETRDSFTDTWIWDGRAWREAAGLDLGAGFVVGAYYEARRRRATMLTSVDERPGLSAYEWDGVGWERTPPGFGSPSARSAAAVTDDGTRGQTLLFGGRDAETLLGDTWTLEYGRPSRARHP